MFERILDKQNKPTYDQFVEYCGTQQNLFLNVNNYLIGELNAESMMRFPYGKSYGWGIKYYIKSKHICDVFAEKDAFTVMMRLTNKQFDRLYDELCEYTQNYIDNKYPCGDGGWIHYRVLEKQHLNDIKKLLSFKVQK